MRAPSWILAAAALAAVACSDGDNGGQGPGEETPQGDILVRNNVFDPSELEVAPGATVVWAWASNGTVHNVTFADAPPSANQGSGTFERTFAELGDYSFQCTIHPATMNGVISVVDAPAPGDGGGGGGGGGGGYP